MLTTDTETVYGVEMPIHVYSIHWGCGCRTENIRLATIANPPADVEVFPQPCPACNTDPGGNVWD